MLGAVVFGHTEMQKAIDAIHELVKEGGKPSVGLDRRREERGADQSRQALRRLADLRAAYQMRDQAGPPASN